MIFSDVILSPFGSFFSFRKPPKLLAFIFGGSNSIRPVRIFLNSWTLPLTLELLSTGEKKEKKVKDGLFQEFFFFWIKLDVEVKGFLIEWFNCPSRSWVFTKHLLSEQSNKTMSAGDSSFFLSIIKSPTFLD